MTRVDTISVVSFRPNGYPGAIRREAYGRTGVVTGSLTIYVLAHLGPCGAIPFPYTGVTRITTTSVVIWCPNGYPGAIQGEAYGRTGTVIRSFTIYVLTHLGPCGAIPFPYTGVTSGVTISVVILCPNGHPSSIPGEAYGVARFVTHSLTIKVLTHLGPYTIYRIPFPNTSVTRLATTSVILSCTNGHPSTTRREAYRIAGMVTGSLTVYVLTHLSPCTCT